MSEEQINVAQPAGENVYVVVLPPFLQMEGGNREFRGMVSSTILNARPGAWNRRGNRYPTVFPLPNNNTNNNNGNGDGDDKDDDEDDTDPLQPFPVPPVEPRPTPVDESITLASVGGLEEHIRFLKRAVIFPLVHQGAFDDWGMDAPKGIMFHGVPGSGKTLLAKALANELSIALDKKFSFFYHKGGESFGKYFGQSQQNLEDLFFAADHYKPSIIFFDEIDGLCPDRSLSSTSSDAYATVVTAFLGLMDAVKRGEVFVIGATNRLDSVDPAIRRSGRFDKELHFSLPNEVERQAIITIHTREWPAAERPTGDLLAKLVKKTNGYSGADIQKACREAVDAAMNRIEDDAKVIHIEEGDWLAALQGMKPSAVNVFGSALFVAQPFPRVLAPLVSNTVDEILAQLKHLVPGGGNTPNSMSHNSLYIWETNPKSEHFTDHTVMRSGVLRDEALLQMPAYILDFETIGDKMRSDNCSLIGAVSRILQQVLSSDKPCVLFIQRIDHLDACMKSQKVGSIFHQQLKEIRGDNVLLLATGTVGLADIDDHIGDLFVGSDRSYAVKLPKKAHRTAFYLQLFKELLDLAAVPPKKAKPEGDDKNNMPDLLETFSEQLEQAVMLTEGIVVDSMTRLYHDLDRSIKQWKNDDMTLPQLAKDIDRVIHNFAKTLPMD